MKLGDTVWAAVRSDGTIQGTPESTIMDNDRSIVESELDNWRIPKEDVRIVQVKLVEVEDGSQTNTH